MKTAIGQKVKVYRNLNNGQFSIKQKTVLGYLPSLVLEDVAFTGAHTKAQKDIQNGAHRSVHAYAVGTLTTLTCSKVPAGYVEVTYRPKERAGFFIVKTGTEVTQADKVLFLNRKMYCLNAR